MPFQPLKRFKTAGVLIGLGGLLGAKVALASWLLKRRAAKGARLNTNRRQFGALPRSYQRSVLYARKSQLKDLENIYRRGYRPRPKALQPLKLGRRRKWF